MAKNGNMSKNGMLLTKVYTNHACALGGMSLSPLGSASLLSTMITSLDDKLKDELSFQILCAFLFAYEATTNILVMVFLNHLAARYRFREYGCPKSNALAVYHNHQNDIMFRQFHWYVRDFFA
jgi:hypothetical protein